MTLSQNQSWATFLSSFGDEKLPPLLTENPELCMLEKRYIMLGVPCQS